METIKGFLEGVFSQGSSSRNNNENDDDAEVQSSSSEDDDEVGAPSTLIGGSYFDLPEINLPAASINEMLRLAGVDTNKHNSDIAIVVAKLFANEVILGALTNMEHHRDLDMHTQYM